MASPRRNTARRPARRNGWAVAGALAAGALALACGLAPARAQTLSTRTNDGQRPLYIDGVKVDTIVAFGDSWTDAGNYYAATGQKQPGSPYSRGRYSNGALYVEILANSTGAGLANFAFAGSNMGTGVAGLTTKIVPGLNVTLLKMAGLLGQVDTYISAPNTIDNAGTAHVVFAGADWYLDQLLAAAPAFAPTAAQLDALATDATKNITRAVQTLYTQGARTFVVVGLPDLSQMPLVALVKKTYTDAAGASFAGALASLTDLHNAKLLAGLSTWAAAATGSRAKFVNLVADPVGLIGRAAFGDMTTECLAFPNLNATLALSATPTPCADAAARFWWDVMHPTTAGHNLTMAMVVHQVNSTTATGVTRYNATAIGAAPTSITDAQATVASEAAAAAAAAGKKSAAPRAAGGFGWREVAVGVAAAVVAAWAA